MSQADTGWSRACRGLLAASHRLDAGRSASPWKAHMSTEEILDDIRLRIESMPLECGPGVTIPALPPVDRHNPPKVKVYGGWKHFIMHVVLAQEEVSKASRRQVATTARKAPVSSTASIW